MSSRCFRISLLALVVAVWACDPDDGTGTGPTTSGPTDQIGTWPTPELDALGEEVCDGYDNDGDGSVDEGCSCTSARTCVGVSGADCVAGEQPCVGGVWQACDGAGEAQGAAQPATVTIVDVVPETLTPSDTAGITVTATVTSPCAGIEVPFLLVSLAAQMPMMRVRGAAQDFGTAPDASADGIYTVSLQNPFGPGAPSQDLTLTVAGRFLERWVEASTTVGWSAE